jgi:hypothetical protein
MHSYQRFQRSANVAIAASIALFLAACGTDGAVEQEEIRRANCVIRPGDAQRMQRSVRVRQGKCWRVSAKGEHS